MKTTKPHAEMTLKNDFFLNTLLIKQMKLLPCPLRTEKDKRRACQTAINNKIRSTKSKKESHDEFPSFILSQNSCNISDFKGSPEQSLSKIDHEQELTTGYLEKSAEINPDPTISEEKLPILFLEDKILASQDQRPLRPKKKKVFSSMESMGESHHKHNKHNKVDEEEIYGSDLQAEDDFTIEELEKRVNVWLDGNNITLIDPMAKKDEYYQKKKNLVMMSAHNSPVKEMESVDCNSPALNMNLNSGLLMKRKMKSTTVCLETRPFPVSKFSQN